MVHFSLKYTGVFIKEKISENYYKQDETKCGDIE